MKGPEFLKSIRAVTIQQLEGLSTDQFNTIPAGFNNNIIWNAAHLIASEQRMLYVRSGLTPIVSDSFFAKYQKGTRPEGPVSETEISEIKTLLSTSLEKFEQDYQQDIFKDYDAWTTSYGNQIENLNDAIIFLPYHEGLHIGCIKALKKLVK